MENVSTQHMFSAMEITIQFSRISPPVGLDCVDFCMRVFVLCMYAVWMNIAAKRRMRFVGIVCVCLYTYTIRRRHCGRRNSAHSPIPKSSAETFRCDRVVESRMGRHLQHIIECRFNGIYLQTDASIVTKCRFGVHLIRGLSNTLDGQGTEMREYEVGRVFVCLPACLPACVLVLVWCERACVPRCSCLYVSARLYACECRVCDTKTRRAKH